jgi:glutathione S-transferase
MALVTAHEAGLAEQIELVPTGEFLPIKPHKGVIGDNPLGRIPALALDDGSVLYDSRVICEYFAVEAGSESLMPSAGQARWRVLTLQALAQGLADSAVQMRYETGLRPADKQWPDLIAAQNARFTRAFDALETAWLDDLRSVNVGSIATAVTLAYMDFRFADLDWRNGRPGLTVWYGSFSQRPSMVATAFD